MRTFACDWCGRVRNAGDRWLLGFAAERVGVTGVQREMSMVARWSDSVAEHPLAVHFCSAGHRNAYIEALFSDIPRAQRRARRNTTRPAAQRSGSTIGLGLGSCAVESQEQSSSAVPRRRAKRATDRKQPAERHDAARFDFGDSIRSHGLGVRLDGIGAFEDPSCGA